jgi:hypothetical protein
VTLNFHELHELFGIGPLQSFRATYRRQSEEMAALGKWEDSWKESAKDQCCTGLKNLSWRCCRSSMVIAGNSEEFREKERLSLEWPKFIGAIATIWKEPWEVISVQRGNGALGLAYYLGQRHAGITLREAWS